ncbi:MAG TPA: serine/threonine-protein kinase [Polyangiaceae bacterium]|nr:serine/threonine-protein kinase [Polyangiaceae bacterium]
MAAPKLIDIHYDGPQKIDRYDLVAEIASGGMATVFLGRLSGVGGFRRFVAIKRLHPHLAREQEFVEMFLDEARLAAGIHHPNVVPILEVGASERGYYLVMEYVEGDTLARLLARAATSGNRLPIPIGTRIIVDMLAGLHAAHELRDEQGNPTELVHRDVSPQNILVGIDGQTRITDFGVARAASRLSATRAGQLKGKIAYMAPEQAVGDPAVDRRADVFSSGIVLWEVLAARRLFKAENEAATLARVISETVPHICKINPAIDPQVGEVVMRALERDADARYATCQIFADDLERASLAAGTISTARDVAGYVGGVIGQDIAQQREAVRAWLARSEPSQTMSEGHQPHATVPPGLASVPRARGSEQSGMVASPIATLGDGDFEEVRRSKAPLIIAGAALLGFVFVALLVLLMGRGSNNKAAPEVPGSASPVQVAPVAAPPATAAPAVPAPTVVAPRPVEPASEAARASSFHSRPRSVAPATPSPSAASAAHAPPQKPVEAPSGGTDVDLSNPYR